MGHPPQRTSLLSILALVAALSCCVAVGTTPTHAQRLADTDVGPLVIGDATSPDSDSVSLDPNGNRRVSVDGVDLHFNLGKSNRRTDIRSYRHALDRTQHNEDYDEKHITIHPDGSTLARRFRRSLGNRRGCRRRRSCRRRHRCRGRPRPRQGGVNIRLGFSRFGQRLRSRFNPSAARRTRRRRGHASGFRTRVKAIIAAANQGADDATLKRLIQAAAGARSRAGQKGRSRTSPARKRTLAQQDNQDASEEPARPARPSPRLRRQKVGGGRLIKGLAGKLRGKVGRGRLLKGAFNKIRGKLQTRSGRRRIGGGRRIKGAFHKIKGKVHQRVGQGRIGRGRLIRGAFHRIKGQIQKRAGRQIGRGRLIKGFASQVGGRIKKKMGKGSKFSGVMKSIGGTFGAGGGSGLLSKGADAAARKIGKGKGGRIVGGLIKGMGGLFGMRLSPYDYEPYDDLYWY